MTGSVLQFLKFCIVGLMNTAIGLLVIMGLMYLFNVSPVLANICGYAVGLGVSFYGNGRWTFGQSLSQPASLRFLVSFGISYLANLGVLLLCLSYTDIGRGSAQIMAMATYTGLFFVLNKLYVFTAASETAPKATK